MQETLPTRAPSFHLIGRQPIRPAALVLAVVVMVAAMSGVLYALAHSRRAHLAADTSSGKSVPPQGSAADDDKDDPNQVDTIVLGDPADAPVPARKGNHVSPVHPTILIRLPRFGDQEGLIPASPTGRLLYDWLAAFNHGDVAALIATLPSLAPAATAAAQVKLLKQTGGFSLLSAKEVEPGLLVFRLRDQTPANTEFLGTLQLRPDSIPPRIATFSLRAVEPASPDSASPSTDASSR